VSNCIQLSFVDGPKVEVTGDVPSSYRVQFIDDDTGIQHYEARIATNNWCAANLRYFVNWRIKVEENGAEVVEHVFRPKRTRVFIQLGSKSLGDTVAWMPFVDEFRKLHECEVHVATHWNSIFNYPDLKFIEPGQEQLADYYAAYRVNAYDNDLRRNKNNWRLVPLQQVAADYLDIECLPHPARLKCSTDGRPMHERYAVLSEFSTFYGKQWNHPGGWDRVVDWLRGIGYTVCSVSKEPTALKDVVAWNNRPIIETLRNIQHADLCVTVSNGIAWLAWSLGVPTVVISGMTDPFVEMPDCIRVHNPDICHGCYGDVRYPIDRGNWLWCPRSKKFECSRGITPEQVIAAIDPHIDRSLDAIALRCGTDKASTHHNYCFRYEGLFAAFKDRPIRLLEIGVDKGASIRTWLEYLPQAEVWGLDVDDCQFTHPRFHFVKGDQDNPELLESLGVFDVVIDDGSHRADAIKATLDILFPKTRELYVIEDAFAVWHPAFAGDSPFPDLVRNSATGAIGSVAFQHGLCLIRPQTTNASPRFSLIMPTKDRPEMIQRAVASVIGQDFADWELIIKDGGESVQDLLPDDPRIRYEHCDGGPFERFNRGMAEARGEILNFCADDDILFPGALRQVHDHIGAAMWCYGVIRRTDTKAIQGEAWDPKKHATLNIVPTPGFFWRKAAYERIGGWDPKLVCADWDYSHRLAARWEPVFIPYIMATYTVHDGQDTWHRQEAMQRDVVKIVRRAQEGHYRSNRVLFIAPHLSTGGMPQYLLRRIEDMGGKAKVKVIEWNNISDEYTVQKKAIRSLCDITTLNGDKAASLRKEVEDWGPSVVHLQEFPELFMGYLPVEWLYRKDRPYRIIETGHSTRLRVDQKKTRPDEFEFVGDWHAKEFQSYGVPFHIARYPVRQRKRPERSQALGRLGLKPTMGHVLQVGLFAPWKNQAFTVRVAALLPEVAFHFVGNMAENFADYWRPLTDSLPANCWVWGERADVDAFYAALDVLLFPSTEECSPLVPKEAMEWGMPVVMRDLDTYCGEFDGKVHYATSVEEAATRIVGLIGTPPVSAPTKG